MTRRAIVLSGGGARGAYAAGVLRYIMDELTDDLGHAPHLDIVCGTSVGAILAAWVASGEDDVSPLDSGVIVDPVSPSTTVPVAGSAAELLLEIGIDMSRLSAEIGDDGDEAATIARIESTWAAIRPEVEASHPELVNSIQSTIDLARNAVDTKRPADGDKAFSLLNDLIDRFTGDG